jgi:hypothetical protein
MTSFTIYLKNYAGDFTKGDRKQEGYVDANQLVLGRLAVTEDPSGAIQLPGEVEAEDKLMQLEDEFGLDREEAEIREVVIDREFSLRLGTEEFADGVFVLADGGKRFILARNCGFEASEEIPDELAEPLIQVLWKLQERLKRCEK